MRATRDAGRTGARCSRVGRRRIRACVLYPAPLRDLLIRIASTGIVRARWSEPILDECFRNILEQRPDLQPEALGMTRDLMKRAIPDCMVVELRGADRRPLASRSRSGPGRALRLRRREDRWGSTPTPTPTPTSTLGPTFR
jgi:hypothetical protein